LLADIHVVLISILRARGSRFAMSRAAASWGRIESLRVSQKPAEEVATCSLTVFSPRQHLARQGGPPSRLLPDEDCLFGAQTVEPSVGAFFLPICGGS